MAEASAVTAPAPNGTPVAAPVVDDRAAFLAEMERDTAAGAASTPQTPAAVIAEPEVETKPAATTDDITDSDLDDDAETPDADLDTDLDEDDELAAVAAKAKADPELAKRLSAVQKQEKRSREAISRERTEFEREKNEWRDQAKAIAESSQRFERLAARAKYDPVAVLTSLGLSEDDFEPAAQMLYAHSKAGAADPKRKEMAQRGLREREYADKLAQMESKHAALEAKLTEKEWTAQADRVLEDHYTSVTKAVSDKTGLVKAQLAKNPARAKAAMQQITYDLAQKDGVLPTAKAVVIAYEKQRRAELRELGIDPASVIKAAPAVANTNAAKPATATNGKTAPGTAAQPAAVADTVGSKARDPMRDLILAELDKLS